MLSCVVQGSAVAGVSDYAVDWGVCGFCAGFGVGEVGVVWEEGEV